MTQAQKFKLACIQMNSGPVIADNLAAAEAMVREAAAQGASFIATPENTCHIKAPQSEKLKTSPVFEEHPAIPQFSALANELGVTILLGSISVKLPEDKIVNRSVLFSANGDIVAYYDKIHLFDVDLEGGESYRESDVVRAGDKAVLATVDLAAEDMSTFKLGMSICYDLRFAALYRQLAQNGAQILSIPAAFTVPTGKAHWHVLLRARAIETRCFVIAPAQCGTHDGGRQTYGHSLIVAPWGEILAEGSADKPEIITADIDLNAVTQARQSVPSLRHDRAFTLEEK